MRAAAASSSSTLPTPPPLPPPRSGVRGLPTPTLNKMLREIDERGRPKCTVCTLAGVHVSVANAMRRTMLAHLPVIGIPFEPYAKNKVIVAANTTDDTDQTIWYRLGNTPVHSLNDALVTDYAVSLHVINDRGNETRVVTTEDLRLERIDHAATAAAAAEPTAAAKRTASAAFGSSSSSSSSSSERAPGEPDAREVFPPSADSGDFVALAELHPPTAAAGRSVLQLRATFDWVQGSGAFAPNLVGYVNSPDHAAANVAWTIKEREIRDTYAREAADIAAANAAGAALPNMRHTVEQTVADARHDFQLTGAKLHFLENSFDFTYEVINRAYSFALAWDTAARILVRQLEAIQASTEDDTLVYCPAGTAARQGYTSVTANTVIGGFGFDVILPGVDYTLGRALSHALIELCFARTRAEAEGGGDSDRLTFCAFHQFTPDDKYGVIRLALPRDEGALVPHHMRTACAALIELFTKIAELVKR